MLRITKHTVFPRMLFALKLYSPSYSVRTTVWPECLLRSPSLFARCSKRCARAIVIRKTTYYLVR